MFQNVPVYPGDPILSLFEAYQKDPRPQKVNLSAGIYCDENGKVPVLSCVKQAKAFLDKQPERPSVYLPMSGSPAFCEKNLELVLGKDHELIQSKRVATIQTIGASGALRIGGDFLNRYFPESEVWVSNPTWGNHIGIFEGTGLKVHTYPYFDPATNGLAFEQMHAAISALPAKSIVLLHPCCHNPTGVDLTKEQWDQLIPVLAERQLIPFIDMAYQGYATDLDEDAYAVRAIASAGIPAFVSNSYSKNFSLYGERCGGLSVFCATEEEANRVLGQLKATVRRNYSSPPAHGVELIATVLSSPELTKLWHEEVATMRSRILDMRQALFNALNTALPGHDFNYLIKQQGMFSYTGLKPEQIKKLLDDYAIYLVGNGRICLTGLNTRNIQTVAQAFAAVQ